MGVQRGSGQYNNLCSTELPSLNRVDHVDHCPFIIFYHLQHFHALFRPGVCRIIPYHISTTEMNLNVFFAAKAAAISRNVR